MSLVDVKEETAAELRSEANEVSVRSCRVSEANGDYNRSSAIQAERSGTSSAQHVDDNPIVSYILACKYPIITNIIMTNDLSQIFGYSDDMLLGLYKECLYLYDSDDDCFDGAMGEIFSMDEIMSTLIIDTWAWKERKIILNEKYSGGESFIYYAALSYSMNNSNKYHYITQWLLCATNKTVITTVAEKVFTKLLISDKHKIADRCGELGFRFEYLSAKMRLFRQENKFKEALRCWLELLNMRGHTEDFYPFTLDDKKEYLELIADILEKAVSHMPGLRKIYSDVLYKLGHKKDSLKYLIKNYTCDLILCKIASPSSGSNEMIKDIMKEIMEKFIITGDDNKYWVNSVIGRSDTDLLFEIFNSWSVSSDLVKENEELKEQIKILPGGVDYLKAKERFEKQSGKSGETKNTGEVNSDTDSNCLHESEKTHISSLDENNENNEEETKMKPPETNSRDPIPPIFSEKDINDMLNRYDSMVTKEKPIARTTEFNA